MCGVFCSIYGEAPDSRRTDLWDPAATLTPVGPGYDSLPLHREKSYDNEQHLVSSTLIRDWHMNIKSHQ